MFFSFFYLFLKSVTAFVTALGYAKDQYYVQSFFYYICFHWAISSRNTAFYSTSMLMSQFYVHLKPMLYAIIPMEMS